MFEKLAKVEETEIIKAWVIKELQGASKVLRDKIESKAEELNRHINIIEDEHLLVDGITKGKNPPYPNLKSFLHTFHKQSLLFN